MRTLFRVGIHKPFEKKSMWAAGNPGKIRVVASITEGSRYTADSVAAVVAMLSQAQPEDTVITVY